MGAGSALFFAVAATVWARWRHGAGTGFWRRDDGELGVVVGIAVLASVFARHGAVTSAGFLSGIGPAVVGAALAAAGSVALALPGRSVHRPGEDDRRRWSAH
jgi:hypothetical protein